MGGLQSFKLLSGYLRKLCKFLEHHFILSGVEAESTPVFRLILTQGSAGIGRNHGRYSLFCLRGTTTELCCLACSQAQVWVSFLTVLGIILLLLPLT